MVDPVKHLGKVKEVGSNNNQDYQAQRVSCG